MVDRWLNKIWEKMDQYNLWENTIVILTSDHGHALAEPHKKNKQYGKEHPIFEDVANIPLIIYHPEIEGGKRIDSTFSTIVDIRATILEALGATIDEKISPDGKSLLPILKGDVKTIRDFILYGSFGDGVNLTTWDTTYIKGYNPKKQLCVYSSTFPMVMSPAIISGFTERYGISLEYEMLEKMLGEMMNNVESGRFIRGVNIPQWRIPLPAFYFAGKGSKRELKQNYLFNRNRDPNFQNNLAGTPEAEDLENQMKSKMIEIMKKEGCPPEQFERLMLDNIK
jgi:hypothetical protein